jgi:L-galactose dehydrogenase
MFAVRSIFANPPRIAREVKELAAKGLVDPSLGATNDPLAFLIHEGGASNQIEDAYRYARHEPGLDEVFTHEGLHEGRISGSS